MAWKQKHNIMYWYMKPHPIYNYSSEAIHMQQEEYNKRGRWGRVSRISGVKRRLIDGMKWVTRRYNRRHTLGKTLICGI